MSEKTYKTQTLTEEYKRQTKSLTEEYKRQGDKTWQRLTLPRLQVMRT